MKISLKRLRTLIREKLDTGPFKKGDNIFYGKYKNKRGKITDTYLDDKEHPAITIEPVSKGRKKKDVEMGLYKVWPDDKINEAATKLDVGGVYDIMNKKELVAIARVFQENEVNIFFEPDGRPAKNNPMTYDAFLLATQNRGWTIKRSRQA